MPLIARALTTMVLAASLPAPALAARGDLRYFMTYPELQTAGNHAGLSAAAVQPDGKVVVAGTAYQGANFANGDWIVARIVPATGALDGTFGTGGVVRIALDLRASGQDTASAVAIGPGGRIYVAGSAESAGTGSDMAVVALTPAGARETAFGPQGVRTADFAANSFDRAMAIAVDPDSGNVTLGGIAGGNPSGFGLLRLDPSGQPVSGFGTAGRVATPIGGAFADQVADLVARPNGGILAVGTADMGSTTSDLAAVAYDALGQPGTPRIHANPGSDTAQDAELLGARVAIALDHRTDQGVVTTRITGLDPATLDLDGAFGGATFGTPSLFGGLAPDPAAGGLVALGIGPFGGSRDALQFAFVGADGRPAGTIRNHPGTADRQELAGAVVRVPGSAGGRQQQSDDLFLMVGQGTNDPQAQPPKGDLPVVGAIESSAGGSVPPPEDCVLALDVKKAPDTGLIDNMGSSIGGVPTQTAGRHARWNVTVTNTGTCRAAGLSMTDVLTGFSGRSFSMIPSIQGTPEPQFPQQIPGQTVVEGAGSHTVTVPLPDLGPGDSVFLLSEGVWTKEGEIVNDARVRHGATGRTFTSNLSKIIATPRPQAAVTGVTKGGFKGTAAPRPPARKPMAVEPEAFRLAKVEVAIRTATGCRRVTSAKGRLKASRAKGCPPLWIKARGTARWRLELARNLPRGRYLVSARATNRAGIAGTAFSFKDRSRVRLRVR